MSQAMELQNQEKIRALGEKGLYKFLGILKADTIKQVVTRSPTERREIRYFY